MLFDLVFHLRLIPIPAREKLSLRQSYEMTELSCLTTVPKVQFRESVYTGEESDGQITATVYRSGDIRHKSSVRCYTRQASAQVASDFDERPNTDASVISFLPGSSVTALLHHACFP